MFSLPILAFIVCGVLQSAHALEQCPGAADDSHEDFAWKYNASSIVAFGTVSQVTDNVVTFQVSCTLKGQLTETTIQFNQFRQVTNRTECHYLGANRKYLVFVESVTTVAPEKKIVYRLADREEIEIDRNTQQKFFDEECHDNDDHGMPMTIFYADSNNKCDRFTATCNENTKASMLNLNYPPLTRSSTFLAGMKQVLPVPNMQHTESTMISGKKNVGLGDEHMHSTGPVTMPLAVVLVVATGLTWLVRHE